MSAELRHYVAGQMALMQELTALSPTLLVLEASGGLEAHILAELAAAEVPVVRMNARQVRDFGLSVMVFTGYTIEDC